MTETKDLARATMHGLPAVGRREEGANRVEFDQRRSTIPALMAVISAADQQTQEIPLVGFPGHWVEGVTEGLGDDFEEGSQTVAGNPRSGSRYLPLIAAEDVTPLPLQRSAYRQRPAEPPLAPPPSKSFDLEQLAMPSRRGLLLVNLVAGTVLLLLLLTIGWLVIAA